MASLEFRSVSDLISRHICCVNCVTVLASCLSPQRDTSMCLQDCSYCSTLYPLINVYDTLYKFISFFLTVHRLIFDKVRSFGAGFCFRLRGKENAHSGESIVSLNVVLR